MTIGLALSGGGFRAALFSLGSLCRLNDFGLLPKLDRITSVSGGSITAALLGIRWGELTFNQNGVATNLPEKIIFPILAFCGRSIDVSSALKGVLNPFSSTSEEIAKQYRKFLFGDTTLQDLPDQNGPRFIIYATSLQTGANFRFSRPYLADYKLGQFPNPNILIADVVAASSAFPPFLSPAYLKLPPSSWRQVAGATLYPRKELRQRICLTDGGVYDNMGLEAIWDNVDTVLVSDAGAPLAIEDDPPKNWLGQMIRVTNVITEQTRALRKRKLIEDFRKNVRQGTYWGIATKIGNYELQDSMAQDSPRTAYLAAIRTRLNPFYGWEKGELINWAYALTDAAIRKHCPQLGQAKGAWPITEYALSTQSPR